VVSRKVVKKVARVVSRVVVAVGVPNSKIRTQTVVEVFGTTSMTIRGTINDSLTAFASPVTAYRSLALSLRPSTPPKTSPGPSNDDMLQGEARAA
jgi:hypothetical protein